MKYLLLILLALLAFHGTYSQLENGTVATIDPSGENEAQSEEEEVIGSIEVFVEEENEEEDSQPDAAGNVNVSVNKWLKNAFNKKVLNFVIQWQISNLEMYGLVPSSSAFQLDKINYIQYNKGENVWRINIRVHDFFTSKNFFTGHSVVQYTETPNESINILRSKYGLNSEVAAPFTDPKILDLLSANFSSIDPDVAQADDEISFLLEFGVDFTIENAVPTVLPEGDWSLKALTAVNIKTQGTSKIYHFNVLLDGPNGYTAKGEISVVKKLTLIVDQLTNFGFDGLYPPTA